MREIRAISPTACVGLGPTSKEAFERALSIEPDFIAADMGSTDPGPYYLGAGRAHFPRFNAKRDLEMMITAALNRGIPCIIGSAGGNGARPHVEWTIKIIEEITQEQGLRFKLAVIYSDIDKDLLKEKLHQGLITPVDGAPPLTEADIAQTTYIVAQMGVEPLIAALETGAQIILASRSCDDALFAALPIKEGFDRGLALHMGKILECAAVCAVPRFGYSAMIGRLREDHFIVEPADPHRICTVTSVAAHSLYERSNPLIEAGPGGSINMEQTVFEQYSERAVKVSGTRFIPDAPYKLKLEGAKRIGFRSISILGVRDPILIGQIAHVVEKTSRILSEHLRGLGFSEQDYKVCHHIYGKNAIMKALEPQKQVTTHELGIVIDVVANDQQLAHGICDLATITLFTTSYEGQKATAGNVAMLYSPWTIDVGEAYTFSIYHLLPVEDPLELFPIEIREVG